MNIRLAIATVFTLSGLLAVFAGSSNNESEAMGLSTEIIPAGVEPVLGIVGDMACDPSNRAWQGGNGGLLACAQQRTSSTMLADTSLDAVLGLGDYQYDCGDLADYEVSYTPTWGRLNAKMNPSAGNHEYKTGTDVFGAACPTTNNVAQNYFDYFGAAAHVETAGHYSFDVGSWHFIAMNANCTKQNVGGCKADSPQTTWLKADLAATAQPCIGAFWHQPLYTGLGTGVNAAYRAWWDALYAAKADVVLNGHIHNYQRFAPLTPTGTADPINGITEYIIGTGGEKQVALRSSAIPQPIGYAKSFGYLRMTLHPTGWTSEFVSDAGVVSDTSTDVCHA